MNLTKRQLTSILSRTPGMIKFPEWVKSPSKCATITRTQIIHRPDGQTHKYHTHYNTKGRKVNPIGQTKIY